MRKKATMNEFNLKARKAYDRADIFLSENLEGFTRSSLKKLFDDNLVKIGDRPIKASKKINENDELSVSLPEPIACEAKPEDIPIEIVYQDNDIAIINKPQGMTVHMGNGNYEGTLVNALLFKLDSLSGINGVIRPGIVHRIDKDTSGLLVVAKNDSAHLSLSKQIEEKTARRTYFALLEGKLKDDSGRVTTYIGRNPQDRLKMTVVPSSKGKLAITEYQVLKRYEGYTLCQFDLCTGRTHQIRVHSKFLGHPIVGDKVYGIKKQKFKLEGQLLHAAKLSLKHPRTDEEMTFEAPLPDYFVDVLKKLKEE